MPDTRQRFTDQIMSLRDQISDQDLRDSLLRIRDEFVNEFGEGQESPSPARKSAPRRVTKKAAPEGLSDFAKAVKEARQSKGMSQTQVASDAGISTLSLSKIEKGETKNPRQETVEKIKSILDIDQGEDDTED